MTDLRSKIKSRQAGFTLIELMVSVLILVIVLAVVFSRIDSVQKTTRTEATKLDLTQDSRQFMDQFARDIHMSGYPTANLYSTVPTFNGPTRAVGMVYASTTQLQFEGDVYGDGGGNSVPSATVYEVFYEYVASDVNDANCPCLRRSVMAKAYSPAGDPVTGQPTPVYYTEIQNLVPTTGVFTYYDAYGNLVDVTAYNCSAGNASLSPARPATHCVDLDANATVLQTISAIKVDLFTQSKIADIQTGQKAVLAFSTTAELEN